MPLDLPLLHELPSVLVALRWLLERRGGGTTTDRNILIKARLCGFITADNTIHWKANGAQATRLAKTALNRLPQDPTKLGNILHGIGEINARTTAELARPLAQHLRARRNRISLLKVLDAAAKCESKLLGKPQMGAIDLAQWISGAPLAWHTFDRAVYRIGHPDFSIGGGRYGLRFAAQIVAMADPRAIDTWIVRHPNRLRIATIGSAALPTVFDPDVVARATLLLRSRIPAIKCLAAALYVCPIFPQPSLDNFRECRKGLVENGIDPGDATWMMGYRIKGAIHARYWSQHQLEQNQARLHNLQSNPDAAIGGRHNFNAEMRSLHIQIDRTSESLSKLDPQLEEMLGDLAADWPLGGLSVNQMESLDYNFVATPEFRHRLSEKLPHTANRNWLLKRNIDQLSGFLGLSKNPSTVLDVSFNPDDDRFDIIAPWAARSLILLYADDHRGIGKRTSDMVRGISEAFEALASEPFAAARAPIRWQSALARAAAAYIFALMVVAYTREAQRGEVDTLNKLAIDHVFRLLCAKSPGVRSSQLRFKLTARAVLQMSYSAAADELRRQWAIAEELPDFARALALWSSPEIVEKDKALAITLFRRVGETPLSRGARDLQISRMLTLLDLAVASCARSAKPHLIRELASLWAEVYKDWQPITGRWANAAEMIGAAIEQDGPERAAFLAEPCFAQTHCRQLIDARVSADVQRLSRAEGGRDKQRSSQC